MGDHRLEMDFSAETTPIACSGCRLAMPHEFLLLFLISAYFLRGSVHLFMYLRGKKDARRKKCMKSCLAGVFSVLL